MNDGYINPMFKEGMLTILIFFPYFYLLSLPSGSCIEKENIVIVLFAVCIGYAIARIVHRKKTGSWKW